MAESYFQVAVSNTSYGYDKLYSYRYDGNAQVGMRVLVPFGNSNRRRIGLILRITEETNPKIKPIFSLIDEKPLISDEMVELIFKLKETTLCTYFEAFRTVIPPGLGVTFEQKYELTGEICELNEEEQQLYNFLAKAKNQREFDLLITATDNPDKKKVIASLLEKGVICGFDSLKRKVKDKSVKLFKLSEKYIDTPNEFSVTAKQKQVVDVLEQNSAASSKEIAYLCSVSSATLTKMQKNGVIESFEYETVAESDAVITESIEELTLSDEQQAVFDGIAEMVSAKKPAGALIYGVTGSGKTSVFAKLIDYTLNTGRQAMMLIPEIALTPQMVAKFQALFGKTVAVVHSSLSMSQRLAEYRRIESGQAKIVVGTRSAVFSPLDNIGIIIMDEEGERSYKSESAPRFHARDAAKMRCAYHNCVLVMASATPSVESYFYAQSGRYRFFELKNRYSSAPLPEVNIVDMATEETADTSGLFSDTLVDELKYNLDHGEQSILLLNRRGFFTYISCPKCREPVVCPKCSIPMTYHKVNGRMMCHFCGYSEEFHNICEHCGYDNLKQTGVGTQKVEDEIARLFPNARLLRMDADTTYSRYAYEKSFSAFGRGEYDIMLGTQMIAKGLDFPNVTLVGVLSLDKALFAGDFRSYERTFSLITQVVGRGGRGGKAGRAILQTFVPEHYVLNLAAKQDYKEFYRQEIALRKTLIFPPYCDVCLIGFTSLIEKETTKCADIFLDFIKKKYDEEKPSFPIKILGPSKFVHGKINGKFRCRLILKTKNSAEFRRFIGEIWQSTFKYKDFSNVTVYIDINGDLE